MSTPIDPNSDGGRVTCSDLANEYHWSAILARSEGAFDAEIEPINVDTRNGEVSFAVDEHPRDAPLEKLRELKPVFKKDGLVTAANASVSR